MLWTEIDKIKTNNNDFMTKSGKFLKIIMIVVFACLRKLENFLQKNIKSTKIFKFFIKFTSLPPFHLNFYLLYFLHSFIFFSFFLLYYTVYFLTPFPAGPSLTWNIRWFNTVNRFNLRLNPKCLMHLLYGIFVYYKYFFGCSWFSKIWFSEN